MREIKFRAWDIDNKEMSDPFNLWDLACCDLYLFNPTDRPDSPFKPQSGKNVKVMQFTGLLDKNGEEIYEGDIVIIEDTLKDRILDDGSGPTEPANHLAPVVFQDGSFGVYIKEHGDCFDKGFWSFIGIQDNIGMTVFEVIGNIYQE